ncbi:MAG TPA: methyltransferase domain-containing protein, partial [Tepidiformaceae bacterium]|nr:methyltransferase domain-containing protein [Tepidiformaceae bacterium]
MGSSAVSDSVRQQFGAVAANYAVSAVHASGADLAQLVAAAGVSGETRALDLGSGAGHTAMAIAAAGAKEVIGVDLTPEMVGVATELAKGRGLENVAFRLGDVEVDGSELLVIAATTAEFVQLDDSLLQVLHPLKMLLGCLH